MKKKLPPVTEIEFVLQRISHDLPNVGAVLNLSATGIRDKDPNSEMAATLEAIAQRLEGMRRDLDRVRGNVAELRRAAAEN